MTIDDEVRVRRALVLAHLGALQWNAGQIGEAAREETAHLANAGFRRRSRIARWIDGRARRIVRDLEPRVDGLRNAVDESLAELEPDRKPLVAEASIAGRNVEVIDFLPCRLDDSAQEIGKQRSEPGTAREDESIRLDFGSIGQLHGTHGTAGIDG